MTDMARLVTSSEDCGLMSGSTERIARRSSAAAYAAAQNSFQNKRKRAHEATEEPEGIIRCMAALDRPTGEPGAIQIPDNERRESPPGPLGRIPI